MIGGGSEVIEFLSTPVQRSVVCLSPTPTNRRKQRYSNPRFPYFSRIKRMSEKMPLMKILRLERSLHICPGIERCIFVCRKRRKINLTVGHSCAHSRTFDCCWTCFDTYAAPLFPCMSRGFFKCSLNNLCCRSTGSS